MSKASSLEKKLVKISMLALPLLAGLAYYAFGPEYADQVLKLQHSYGAGSTALLTAAASADLYFSSKKPSKFPG